MKQIKEEKDLIGKTILKTEYSDNIFMLLLSGDSYAIFQGCGYEDHDVELRDEEFSLKPTVNNCYELLELGVITEKEKKKIYADSEAERQKVWERHEHLEYERLKSKFETK